MMRRAGPNFLAVDYPIITIQFGFGGQACQIAPGAGLGITLAPDHFSVNGGCDERLFLLLRTHFQQNGGEHGNPLPTETPMHASRAEFFSNDARFYDVGFRTIAPVFTGNCSAVVSVFNQQALPVHERLAPKTIARLGLPVLVLPNKRFDFLAEVVVLRPVC